MKQLLPRTTWIISWLKRGRKILPGVGYWLKKIKQMSIIVQFYLGQRLEIRFHWRWCSHSSQELIAFPLLATNPLYYISIPIIIILQLLRVLFSSLSQPSTKIIKSLKSRWMWHFVCMGGLGSCENMLKLMQWSYNLHTYSCWT